MPLTPSAQVQIPALLLEGSTERERRVLADEAARLMAERKRQSDSDACTAPARYARPVGRNFLRVGRDRRVGRAARKRTTTVE